MNNSSSFVSKRSRKRAQRLENMDVYSDGDDEPSSAKTISFLNGDDPLKLLPTTKNFRSGSCNQLLIGSPNWWHKITICHEKRFNCLKEVLPEVYKVVDDCFFVPIAYSSSLTTDYFFVHEQGAALEKLFMSNLQIDVKGRKVELAVQLCVARFEDGMIRPRYKLREVIKRSIDPSHPYTMNLSHLASHKPLNDMKFNLSNKSCLNLLIEQMHYVRSYLERVRVIDLSNNDIQHLEPLSKLPDFHLRLLNLKYNKIASIDELNALKNINIDEIHLIGNPVTDQPGFYNDAKQILSNLKRIDEVEMEMPVPMKIEFEENLFSEPEQFRRPSPSIRTTPMPTSSINVIIFRPNDVNDQMKREFPKHKNGMWNKVVIHHHGKVKKHTILSEMNKQFFNRTLFYPCYYEQQKDTDTFLLYNNFSALEMLVQKDLKMKILSKNCFVKFELNLQCAEWREGDIDWRHQIEFVIRSRTKQSSVDLSDLANDTGLGRLIVTMTTVQGVSYILKTAMDLIPEATIINMRSNKIASIEGLQFLKQFSNLKLIDLRANEMTSLTNLPVMSNVVEVLLDKNPICREFYKEPWKYVGELLKVFPKLEYIDNTRIDPAANVVPMRNFFVSQNLYTLIESFIKFYFNFYDSSDRKHLRGLYEMNSMYSVSSEEQQNGSHKEHSRNLLKDLDIVSPKIVIGKDIIELHKYFPQTLHDFAAMCVDVPFYDTNNVLINVTGYFKEIAASLNEDDRIFGFTRSFLLDQRPSDASGPDKKHRFVVKNEQLQVRDISSDELNRAFRKSVVTADETANICPELMPKKSEQEEAAVLMLRRLTDLNKIWCKRILADANWDIATALKFVGGFIERQILTDEDFQ